MPYFKWIGIDITGKIKRGKQVASSGQDLSDRFLKQGIAILYTKILYTPFFLWPINAHIKSNLFKQQAKLLQAGLLLPKVLEVTAQQSAHPLIHDTLMKIYKDIQHGIAFDKSLEKYHILCDPIVKIMITAGYESGNVISALENIALYFHKKYLFYKNIRHALAIPLCTLLFFMGISFFIFVFIIPRFADMFNSLQQELPQSTQLMLFVSEWITSFSMIYAVICLGIIIFCLHRYGTTQSGRRIYQRIIENIPVVGNSIWQHHMSQAFQSLSLLVKSGVSLTTALKIVSDSLNHDTIKDQLKMIEDDVAAGQLLSAAMANTFLFSPEIIALVCVGEESGSLSCSLESVGLLYNEKVEDGLRRFILFIQPIAIILLGLLITMLIIAIYAPIMQISYVL